MPGGGRTPGGAPPPIRALLVDDSADLRTVVRRTLEAYGGFEVVGEAADGSDAVRVVADVQPDIVLLDLEMPGRGGLEALPDIAAVAPRAKVVVLSIFRREAMEQAARDLGATAYLEKGIPAARLVDEIVAVAGVLETVEGVLDEVRAGMGDGTETAGSARRFVAEALRRWHCHGAFDTVRLLTSEVVTNAIVHARSNVEVAVRLLPSAIRVEVFDESTDPPVPRAAGPEALSGRGLLLVDALSTDWGVEALPRGKVVWFEAPRLDADEGGRAIK